MLSFVFPGQEEAEQSTVTNNTRLREDSTHLVTEQSSFAANHLFKDVFADVWVDGAQWIVQQVDIAVLVDGSSHRDSLLLSAAQINSLTKATAPSSDIYRQDNSDKKLIS